VHHQWGERRKPFCRNKDESSKNPSEGRKDKSIEFPHRKKEGKRDVLVQTLVRVTQSLYIDRRTKGKYTISPYQRGEGKEHQNR